MLKLPNLIKQPNGKYCSTDLRGEMNFFNYTEQDIMDMYIEKAKEDMNNAEHYGKLIERIENGEVCHVKRTISDEHLELMGFDRPYNELVKFVPRRPIGISYVSCDFATYGKCPNCRETVMDGMGHKDEKCRHCGQILQW